jgi:transcriptional regulator with XRE-family HTH domain
MSADALARLGAAVRGARTSYGLSQLQLEWRSGVDQSAISRLENGIAPGMQMVRLARIAAALPHSRLFGFDAAGSEAPPPPPSRIPPPRYAPSRIQGVDALEMGAVETDESDENRGELEPSYPQIAEQTRSTA